MFSFLRKSKNNFKVQEDTLVYAIGDIHGRFDLLKKIQQIIYLDADSDDSKRKVIVYLGDYIDRGPQSKQVLDYLISTPMKGFESYHLLGNHEYAMLKFIAKEPGAEQWLAWGGDTTILSYGLVFDRNEEFEAIQEGLIAKLPENHLNFLQNLLYMHEEGDYMFVHAGIRPNISMERQDLWDLLTIRDDFYRNYKRLARPVVFGHTVFEAPYHTETAIGIDTGAYATAKLTALALKGSERKFICT
jgi:serine/threonine protein phosphatase 1